MTITDPTLALRWKQQRFNPIRNLTPAILASALDEFESGYLRRAALIWETVERRDGVAQIAAPKRKKSVARRPWQIIAVDESPEALAQKETLEWFYNHIQCTDAADLNVRTGFSGLVRQMMSAVFFRYAAHEIIWSPMPDGRLGAELRFVPLYFFENRTGRLQFVGADGLLDGSPLDEAGWMITVGDGTSEAISVAYMFKRLSLQDWLSFSEKFGIPGIHGLTDAAEGTPEWDRFVEALRAFASDWITATNRSAEIKLVETTRTGDAPFAPMVEYMDKIIAALCRGADLGTLSAKDSAGASLQSDESALLMEDDCQLITETLNTHLDRVVLRHVHGTEEGLAYIRIQPPSDQDAKTEMAIDQGLGEMGFSQEAAELGERYGRTLTVAAKPETAAPSAPVAAENDGRPSPDGQLRGQAMARAREIFFGSTAQDMQPVRRAIDAVLQGDDATLPARARALYDRMGEQEFADEIIAAQGSAKALYDILSAAAATGLSTAA